jgi:hypothetical protein
MKTLNFKYTKKNGSVSNRTILALVVPTDKYEGIDLSEIGPEGAACFVADVMDAYDNFLGTLDILQDQYDLNNSYRQFLASGVSELTVI